MIGWAIFVRWDKGFMADAELTRDISDYEDWKSIATSSQH